MRPRQNGERGESLGMLVGYAPRDLSAPVVADQVEALALAAGRIGDLDGVIDQPVESVVGKLGGIGPRARRVAALVGRDRPVASGGERGKRRVPAVPRFRKAVQQQNESTIGRA